MRPTHIIFLLILVSFDCIQQSSQYGVQVPASSIAGKTEDDKVPHDQPIQNSSSDNQNSSEEEGIYHQVNAAQSEDNDHETPNKNWQGNKKWQANNNSNNQPQGNRWSSSGSGASENNASRNEARKATNAKQQKRPVLAPNNANVHENNEDDSANFQSIPSKHSATPDEEHTQWWELLRSNYRQHDNHWSSGHNEGSSGNHQHSSSPGVPAHNDYMRNRHSARQSSHPISFENDSEMYRQVPNSRYYKNQAVVYARGNDAAWRISAGYRRNNPFWRINEENESNQPSWRSSQESQSHNPSWRFNNENQNRNPSWRFNVNQHGKQVPYSQNVRSHGVFRSNTQSRRSDKRDYDSTWGRPERAVDLFAKMSEIENSQVPTYSTNNNDAPNSPNQNPSPTWQSSQPSSAVGQDSNNPRTPYQQDQSEFPARNEQANWGSGPDSNEDNTWDAPSGPADSSIADINATPGSQDFNRRIKHTSQQTSQLSPDNLPTSTGNTMLRPIPLEDNSQFGEELPQSPFGLGEQNQNSKFVDYLRAWYEKLNAKYQKGSSDESSVSPPEPYNSETVRSNAIKRNPALVSRPRRAIHYNGH